MFNVKNQIIKPILLLIYIKKKKVSPQQKVKGSDSALNGQCDEFKMKTKAGLVT